MIIGRTFDSEHKARDGATKLEAAGFDGAVVFSPGSDPNAIKAMPGYLPAGHGTVYARSVQQGQWLVLVDAPFGTAEVAVDIMNRCGPIDRRDVPIVKPRNPSPLSDTIAFPTLSTRGRSLAFLGELTSSSFSFSSMVGLPLLSNNPTPLSSAVGLKTTSSGTTNFGVPLLTGKKNRR